MGLNFLTNQGIGSYSGSQSTSAQHSRYTCDNRTGAGLNFANMSDTVTAPCDEIGNEDGLALGRVCFLTASRDAGDGGGEEDMLECEKTTYQNDCTTNTVEHIKQFATLDTVGFDDLENDDCGICATESVDDKYQTFEVTEGRLATLSTAMYVPVNDDGMAIQNGGSFEIHNEVQSFPDNLVPGNGLLGNTVPVDSLDDNVAETYVKPQNGFSTGTLAPSSFLPALPLWPMPSKQGRGRQKAFHCKSCQLQVESEAELVQHFRTHGDRKLQIEEQAERMNLDSGNVPSHTADGKATGGNGISSMPRGPIRCEECGYNTSRYDHYLAHLKHHEQAGGVKGTLHVLSCTLCPYSTVSRYHWKKHLRNHFPCKVYTCSECSYFSDRKNNYLQHMRTHTGERPYCCPHCSYRSSQKTHLTRHMRVHSGEKPFKCMQCSYVAANQHEVTRHFRQVHNGPKPFGCEHCNYRTADRSNYKKHVELHTRPRQFHCPVCHYAASKKCNLQYHIRSKHPDSNLVTMDVSHVRLRGSSRGRRGVGMSKTGIESKVTVASNTEDDVESDFKDSEKGNCDADHMAFVKKYNDDADDGMVVGKEKADADEGRAIDKDKSDVKDGAVLNKGKSDVEMGTPVDKGKSNVGMGILVGKGKRHVEKRTLVGKGKSDIGKGTTMGKGRSDVGKGTPVRKSKSGKGTPVGKGKSDLEKSTPVEKGKSDVDKGTPVGKGKSDVDKGTPVGKGKSDVDKGTPVGKGKSDVDKGTPVGKGKSDVDKGTPVGKGKSDVDKGTPVGKGKSDVDKGTPVGKGKSDVDKGTPVGKGKSDVDKGTPVGKGKSDVDKGTPVGKGKSDVDKGTPVGKGKNNVENGTPVGKGKNNVEMGTPVGKGKSDVDKGTPVGKGKSDVDKGTPVGKGKNNVENGTPVGKGKNNVEMGTPVGKGKSDVENGTPVGKGKSSIEKGTPVGKGKSSVEKGTPVGKGKSNIEKGTPVSKGKSDIKKGTPVGKGESDVEMGTPGGKGKSDRENGTPVGKGKSDRENGTPVGKSKSDVEKGTPVGHGKSDVEKGTPVGKGMHDVEKGTPVGKGKSDVEKGTPVGKGKSDVEKGTPVGKGKSDVEKGTPVGKGKSSVEKGTPVGKGKSDRENGTPVGKGKSNIEKGTPVSKGKSDVKKGTPVGKGESDEEMGTPGGKGKSDRENGAPVGKGESDEEMGTPGGKGKSDRENGAPVSKGKSDVKKGTPVGKSKSDVEKGTPVGKGKSDVEKCKPVGQGKSDVEKGTPVGKGESDLEKGTPVGKGMRDVERIIRKSKSNLKSRVTIIRRKCLVKRDFIIETSEGDVTIADGSDTISRNNTNSVEGNGAVTDESESDVDESVFSAGSREGDVEAGVCVTKKKERDKDSSVVMVKRKEVKSEGGANALRSEVEVESSKVDKNTQFEETGDGAEQGRSQRHGKQISISIEGRGGEAQKNLKTASLSPKEIMTGEQDAVARPNEGSKRKSIDQKSNNMRIKDASRQHGVNLQGRDKRDKVNDVTKEGDSKSSQKPDVSKSEFKECGGKLESLQGSAPRKPDMCKRHMRQKHVCAQQETSCVDGVASKREVLLEQTEKHVDHELGLCLRNNRLTGSPRKRSQQTIATEMQRSILPKRLKFSSPVTLIDFPPTEKPFAEWCERAGLRNNLTEQQVSSRGQQECCNTGSDYLHFGNSLGSTDNASTVGEGRKMKLVAERVTKDGLLREEVELPNSSTEDSNPLDVECFASMSPEFACALRLRMVCRPRDETGIEGDSLAAAQTKDLDGPRVHGGEAVTPLIPNSEKVLSLRMTDGAIRPVFSERTSEDEGIDSDTESDSLANRCRRGLFTDSNHVIRETDQTTDVNFHPGMIKQAICDGVASGGQVSCAGERKRSMCTETQHADLESLGLSDRRPKGEKAGCPSCVFCNMPFPSDKELGHHLRRHLFNVVVT